MRFIFRPQKGVENGHSRSLTTGTGILFRGNLCQNARAMDDKDSRDLKVLLVEDFEDTRLLMRLELEDLGFIVFEAENGKVAVETAIRERPDVILMDLTLPLMDGFAPTKLIRQNENLKTVPIIAVTAHQEDDFRSDAKASGFAADLTKPIDATWLKELVAGLLI